MERLVQAETLWSLLDDKGYPRARFDEAWRRAILYDEHTFGSWNSISDPDSEFSRTQADFKRNLARDADERSRRLLDEAVGKRRGEGGAIEVYNTLTWPRTDVVLVPEALSAEGDRVRDEAGEVLPSQRLASGELAFLAADIPALGSARFVIGPGAARGEGSARCAGAVLGNGLVEVTLDAATGAIESFRAKGIPGNLVDRSTGMGLNEYVYVNGRDREHRSFVESGSVRLRVLDPGPLVATLEATSKAPGASGLTRRLRVVHGRPRLDLFNRVDKSAVREKEGVFFAFPFNVPDGEVRLDMPLAVVRPEKDQIRGACRNFFAIQRWADVSGVDFGITLATLDAPLVQMGAIRTDVMDDAGWLTRIESSPLLYSYVMNNYWETNYMAEQSGLIRFDYSLLPHQGLFDQAVAQRFGLERHRPLIVAASDRTGGASLRSPFALEAPGVICTSIRPARKGKGWLARVFAASGKPERIVIDRPVFLSDPAEESETPVRGALRLPAYGVATLRVE